MGDRLKWIRDTMRAARTPSPGAADQVQAILDVNGFIRFEVTAGSPVTVALHPGHYQTGAYRRLTLAQMSNRLMDYGLLVETRDGCLHVRERGSARRDHKPAQAEEGQAMPRNPDELPDSECAEFDPLAPEPVTGPLCEKEGVDVDTYGGEREWRCGRSGTVPVPSGRLLCEDHAGELGYGPKQEEYGFDPADEPKFDNEVPEAEAAS
jgi:hypothetical protein